METHLRALARQAFRYKVHSFQGQGYEDLFVQVMQYKNRQFRPVKPQGRFGDRKNDGFDPERGLYYQVFAPEDLRKNPSTAVKKIRGDFAGLKKAWKNIREFYFVINDKYRGVYPEIEAELEAIKRKYRLKVCKPFLAHDLEATLFSLPDDVLAFVSGLIQSSGGISMHYEFAGMQQSVPVASFIPDTPLLGEVKYKSATDQQRRYLQDRLGKLVSSQLAQQILVQVSDADKQLLGLVGTGNILSRLEYLGALFPNVRWKAFVKRMKKRGCILDNSRLLQLAENIEEAVFHDRKLVRSAQESWITALAPNAHYWDLALALCIHLVAVGDWQKLIEHGHDMVFAVEEAWVSKMFYDILSKIDTPKIRRKLRSRDKVILLNALGIYHIQQGRNSDALAHFRKMLAIARSGSDAWGIGQALLHKGIAWVNAGNLRKAEQSYRQAEAWARKHGDHWLLGRILNNLFYCLKERDPNLAARAIKESIEAKKRSGDRIGLAAAYTAHGILAADAERYRESLIWFRRTERTARRFGERYAEAQALHNQSKSLLTLNRYQEAITCERRAYEIAKSLERADLLELVVQGLAMGLYQADLEKAALPKFLEVYEAKVARGDIAGAATALSDAGAMALNLEDHATARKYFRKAIRIGLKNKNYNCVENPILNLSVVWMRKDKTKRALQFLSNHVVRFESVHHWKGIVALIRRMIAMLEEKQSDRSEIETLWTRAIAAAKKSKNVKLQIDVLKDRYASIRDRGDTVGALKAIKPLIQLLRQRHEFLVDYLETLNEVGNEVQKLGGYDTAENIYRGILGIAKKIMSSRLYSISLSNLAETLRRTNRPVQAVPLFREAIKLCEIDDNEEGLLIVEHNLALALQAIGKSARAKVLLGKVRDKSRRRMDWQSYGNAWLALGDLALSGGKKYLARNRYRKAKNIGQTHGVRNLVQQVQDREHQLTPKLT